jgi:FkbM family methyltransferase
MPPGVRHWVAHPAVRRAPVSSTARLAAWFALCRLGRPVTVDFESYGVRFRCPPEWRGLSRLVFALRERYDTELAQLGRLVGPGAVVVDGGAHYGSYTLALARIVGGDGLVLAWEPARHACVVLEANLALNHLANVRLIRAALGAEPGMATLQLHGDPSRSSLGSRRSGTVASEEVAVCRMDDSVREHTDRPVSFIKLDVEGAEPLALGGAQQILERDRPTLLFEFQPAAVRRLGLDPMRMWRTLAGLGYRYHRFSDTGRLLPVAVPPASGTHNLIAIHDARATDWEG